MKKQKIRIVPNIYCFIFFTSIFLSYFCPKSHATQPFIRNFTRFDYQAASQNWAICFDEKGYTYFGNDSGLLEYDGKDWILHPTTNNMVVKSLCYDPKTKRIYSGGYCDFGYWSRNKYGHLIYHSIIPLDIKQKMKQELIWSISKTNKAIYFQSYQNIYIQDNITKKWTTIANTFSLTHNTINDTIYTEARYRGIMKIVGNTFQIIPKTKNIENMCFFLPWNKKSILIGSKHNGLFVLDKGVMKSWNTPANKLLTHKNINRGIVISDSTLMIGTLDDGIYLIDKQGHIVNHINKRNGLVNNTILNMNMNEDKSTYLATDNGISIIQFNAEMNYLIDMQNNPGLITQVFETDHYFYIGTNNGIYYTPNIKGNFKFEQLKRMPSINGHIWYIKRFENKLFCGANNGLFEIEGKQAHLISDNGGGSTSLTKLPNENGFLSTNYYRMSIITKEKNNTPNEKLQFEGLVKGINNTCINAIFDSQNHLWVCGEHEGLFQSYLDKKNLQLNSIKKFGKSDGLSNSYNLHIAYIDGHLIVCNNEGFFIYDSLNNKLIPDNKLNNLFKEGQKCTNITIQDRNHFWLCTPNSALLIANKNNNYEIEKTYLFEDKYIFPDKFQNISVLKDKVVFCLEKGIGVIHKNISYTYKKYPLEIRKVKTINHNIEKELPVKTTNNQPIKLSASSNNIQLFYRTANYTPNLIRYRWRILTKRRKEKIPWNHTFDEDISLRKLKAGEYIIEIKALFDDHTESNISKYYLEVNNSFLKTNLGYMTLCFAFFLIVSTTFLIYKWLLRKNERKLKLKHAREIRKKKTAIKELQNDLMKKQVEKMHSELTLTTNALVQKDEALQTVKNSLDEVYIHLNGRFPKHDYNKIIQVLNHQKSREQDRKEFERHFQQSQEGFYQKLRNKYPELTNNDMRLCSLLRMNMNTKEIAEQLRISPKSAEVSRYRLRKKLMLDSKVNLSKFLQEVIK